MYISLVGIKRLAWNLSIANITVQPVNSVMRCYVGNNLLLYSLG